MSRKKGSIEPTIGQLWHANKKVLQKAGYSQQDFINIMHQYKRLNNVRNSGAFKIFKHREEFVDELQVGFENVIKNIKNEGRYDIFRKEVQGWKNKIDYSKVTYDKGKVEKVDDNTTKQDWYQYTNFKGKTYAFFLTSGSYGSQYWDWKLV